MPTPANIIIDGAQAYGSFTVTVGGVAFLFEDVKIPRPIQSAKDYTATGLPGRKRTTADFVEGCTATIQIPSTLARPARGDQFTQTFDANYGSENWVVEKCEFDANNSGGEIRKCPIEFSKVVNTITTAAS